MRRSHLPSLATVAALLFACGGFVVAFAVSSAAAPPSPAGADVAPGFTGNAARNGGHIYYLARVLTGGTGNAGSVGGVAIPPYTISGLLLQSPHEIDLTIAAGQATENIYARVRVKFVTVLPGPTEGLLLQIGYGVPGTLPGSWNTWQEMSYHQDYGEWEEWQGKLMPDRTGAFSYLVRASATAGHDWFYAGFRSGTRSGGALNVLSSGDTTAPAAPTGLHEASATLSSITLAWNANSEPDLYGYDLYRRVVNPVPPDDPGWIRLATVLSGTTSYLDRNVVTRTVYEYYLEAIDRSYNRSAKSVPAQGVPEARMVRVIFNVTVPGFTPAPDTIYLAGNQDALGPWDPASRAMTRVDATHWTANLKFLDGTALEFKYTRGSWDTVEWWQEIHDQLNRHHVVQYGLSGTDVVNDTVPNWRDPLVVSTDPPSGDTSVPVAATFRATFNRGIRPEDLDETRFVLHDPLGNVVPSTASFDPVTFTASLAPAASMLPNTQYTWNLGPGIGGDAGSAMQSRLTLTFLTAP